MKVIATKKGYFGKLREPGDEFDVPEKSKASWFNPVEAAKAAETEKQDDKPAKSKDDKKPESGK